MKNTYHINDQPLISFGWLLLLPLFFLFGWWSHSMTPSEMPESGLEVGVGGGPELPGEVRVYEVPQEINPDMLNEILQDSQSTSALQDFGGAQGDI